MVPSVSDVKELVSTVGFPTTVVLMALGAFSWGFIPSKITDIRDDVLTTKIKEEHQTQLMERMIEQSGKQHAEQLHNLTAAMKQICINTARTERRLDDCLKIDSHLTR